MLLYVKRWLAAPIRQPDGKLVERDRGTPQDRLGEGRLSMLTSGFNHVAVLTSDTERFHASYDEVSTPSCCGTDRRRGIGHPVCVSRPCMSGLRQNSTALRAASRARAVFQIDGNSEARRQTPMFGRGRLDHIAFQAASLECEVCVANPDAVPGVSNPPGNRSARYM